MSGIIAAPAGFISQVPPLTLLGNSTDSIGKCRTLTAPTVLDLLNVYDKTQTDALLGNIGSNLSPIATSGSYNDLLDTPTTLAGYGIVDGATVSYVNSTASGILSLVSTNYQPLDSDLTAIAGLTTTVFGRSLLTEASASSIKTTLVLATVATTGAYSDLTGRPTIPSAQVNSDWNSSSGIAQILHKPTTIAGYGIVDGATISYVDTAVANLVNSSPSTLDTLKELADALGDDPNFATTTATALGNRLRYDAAQTLSGGQKTQAQTNLGTLIGTNVQAWDADLDAFAALTTTAGFIKKTGANAYSIDTSTYLTGITSNQITTALGYTPYNDTNPSGYISSNQTITFTGDVTGTGNTSVALTVANATISLAKMADVDANTVFYRKTSGTGVPEVQSLTTLKTDLGLTGTNSGDQDLSLYLQTTGGTLVGPLTVNAIINAQTSEDYSTIAGGIDLRSDSRGNTGIMYYSDNFEILLQGVAVAIASVGGNDWRIPSDRFFAWSSQTDNFAGPDAKLGRGNGPTIQSFSAGGFEVKDLAGDNFAPIKTTSLVLPNGSSIHQGLSDAGFGGNYGIDLECSVGYHLKWDSGRLFIMQSDGITIRGVLGQFVAPTASDNIVKGYVTGSRWTMDDGSVYRLNNDTEDENADWSNVTPVLASDSDLSLYLKKLNPGLLANNYLNWTDSTPGTGNGDGNPSSLYINVVGDTSQGQAAAGGMGLEAGDWYVYADSNDGKESYIEVSGDRVFIYNNNGSQIHPGQPISGLGGNGGIELECASSYRKRWMDGITYTFQANGTTIRNTRDQFSAPGQPDDITHGHVVGSRWCCDNGDVYQCTDNSEENAVWENVTPAVTGSDVQFHSVGIWDIDENAYGTIELDGYYKFNGSNGNPTGIRMGSVQLWDTVDSLYRQIYADSTTLQAIDFNVINLGSGTISGTNTGDQDLSGKADLVDGLVPANQLPSYVDDVLEFADFVSFPGTGETGKIYIDLDTELTYRWSGSTYAALDPSLALGETSNTAYRGDRGKIAYDHSQATGNAHSLTGSDVRTILGISTLTGSNTGDQTITLTGDVTGSGVGSFATTITAASVTLANMANMATSSLIYRKTAGSGAPEVNTLATLKTDLGLTGTNSGDQDLSSYLTSLAASSTYLPLAGGTMSGPVTGFALGTATPDAARGLLSTIATTGTATSANQLTYNVQSTASGTAYGLGITATSTATSIANLYAFTSTAAVSSGTTTNVWGGSAAISISATASVTAARAMKIGSVLSTDNDVTTLYGAYITASHSGAGTIGTRYGIYVENPTGAGVVTANAGIAIENQGLAGGTITSYGLLVKAQTGATTNYAIYTNAGAVRFGDAVTITQPVSTSGSPTALTITGGAHTTLAVSTEATDVNFNLSRTVQFSNSTITTQRAVRIQAPTYAFNTTNGTITTAATLAISDAPQMGTNWTFNTFRVALLIESGQTRVSAGDQNTPSINLGTYNFGPYLTSSGWTWVNAATGFVRLSTTALMLQSGTTRALGFGNTFGDTPTTAFYEDATGSMSLRNSTASQTLRISNTYTSSTNNELLQLRGVASANFEIGPYAGSAGGTLRGLTIGGYAAGASTITGWANFIPVSGGGLTSFYLGPYQDSAATGGNARGANAVDLQLIRSVAAQVASGLNSFLGPAYRSKASGDYSVVLTAGNSVASGSNSFVGSGSYATASGVLSAIVAGQECVSAGNYSFVGSGLTNLTAGQSSGILCGEYGSAPKYGQQSHASGAFAVAGDAQRVMFVLRNKTTNNTATTLFLDGASAKLTITNGKALLAIVKIYGVKSDGSASACYVRRIGIKNVGGTTSLVGTIDLIGVDVEDNVLTDIAITADDTNDALKIEVTGITSETWRWVASVEGVEVAYGT